MPTPPTFTKVNPADQPILYLVITSTTVPPWTLDEYAETRIAQRISMVSGVAQVQVLGSQKLRRPRAARSARARGARRSASTRSRRRCATGTSTRRPDRSPARTRRYTLQATGQLMNAEEYKNMIVAYRNGAPVRLRRARQRSSTASRTSGPRRGSTPRGRVAARDHARHPAAAGHQHDRGRRRRQGAAAPVQAGAADQRPHGRALRPLGHDPRVVSRRAVHRCC